MCRLHSERNTAILWYSCREDTGIFRCRSKNNVFSFLNRKYLLYNEKCTLCIRFSWLSLCRMCVRPNSTLLCTPWTLPLSSRHGRSAQKDRKNKAFIFKKSTPYHRLKSLYMHVNVPGWWWNRQKSMSYVFTYTCEFNGKCHEVKKRVKEKSYRLVCVTCVLYVIYLLIHC